MKQRICNHIKTAVLIVIFTAGFSSLSEAQQKQKKVERQIPFKKKKEVKQGWLIAPLPIISFNTDVGLRFGAIANIYDYGAGETYPDYRHFFYVEATYTTKNSGIFRLFYDSDKLLKLNKKYYRITADLSYLLDGAMNFYGFNGYESNYDRAYENPASDKYITRLYYRQNRKLFRAQIDIHGFMFKKKMSWVTGVVFLNYQLRKARGRKLSKKEKNLPDTTTLFEDYIDYGLIATNESRGGVLNIYKFGIIYDTRNIKANASRGLWEEVVVYTNLDNIMGNHYGFAGITAIHRQYITLIKNRLTFVYRLGAKIKLNGEMPFYFTPYIITSFNLSEDRDGLGGAGTLRGISRNRITGDGVGFGNFCLRYKLLKFRFLDNDSYISLNGFMDAGQVIQEHGTDAAAKEKMEKDYPGRYFNKPTDALHISFGGGFHFSMSENFVLRLNYGKSLDPQDGNGSLYLTTNWIF
jgi:hypothetical protein